MVVRLTLKLALAVLPGALLVVAAAALLELRRDRAEFEADQRSDDRATAGAFADSMGKMWEAVGERPVRQAMERLATFEARYRVSWIDLGRADATLPSAERAAVARGEEILWRDGGSEPPGWLHAVSPVHAGGRVVGAVDVSEPPPDLRAHVRRTIRATLVTTLALAATMMLMTLLVGAWVVGGPIAVLINQARRVAAGDLGARSIPRQQDELGALTRELNRMLDRLEGAAAEVRASTRERFDALEQLRHAERLTTVGRLASSVAHELGTPLNVVTGRARLIVEDEHEAATHARIIIDQAERMTKIIRQLLDYARRRPPQKGEQDLSRLAADLLPMLSTLASKKSIQLEFRAEVDARTGDRRRDPGPAGADQPDRERHPGQRRRRDGRRHLARGEARPLANGHADGKPTPGETFELAVRDHGPGMPPEVLARVFEPFFTTKPIGESTGLGLSVTHDIVDEHGGWIEADSAPGRGSRFSMFLPRRAA